MSRRKVQGRRRNAAINTPSRDLRKPVFALMLGVLVVGAVWYVKDEYLIDDQPAALMPIENVHIEGAFKHVSLTEIQHKINDVLVGGYFTMDLDVIRDTLLEMPWVEDASVRRQWPAGLGIHVIEKRAVAYWGDDALMSDRGELFSPKNIDHQIQRPRLAGPEGLHAKVWQYLVEINRDFVEMGMQLEQLSLDERRAWRLVVLGEKFTGSVEVKLGKTEIASRLNRFKRVFSMHNAPDLASVKVVDMRYPNGFAMRKKNTQARTASLVKEVSKA